MPKDIRLITTNLTMWWRDLQTIEILHRIDTGNKEARKAIKARRIGAEVEATKGKSKKNRSEGTDQDHDNQNKRRVDRMRTVIVDTKKAQATKDLQTKPWASEREMHPVVRVTRAA